MPAGVGATAGTFRERVDRHHHRIGQGRLVVRRDEPAVRLAVDHVDEARRAAARRRDHRQLAGHRLEVHQAERLVGGGRDEAVSAAEAERKLVVAAPSAEEHALDALARDDGVRMLALPLARHAAPDHERCGHRHASPCAGVRSNQQWQALEAEKAPDEHQHRQRLAGRGVEERLEHLGLGVANAPRRRRRLIPALRVADEPAQPVRAPLLDGRPARSEALDVDAVREVVDGLRVELEQPHGLVSLVGRDRDRGHCPAGRRAHARCPPRGVRPAIDR